MRGSVVATSQSSGRDHYESTHDKCDITAQIQNRRLECPENSGATIWSAGRKSGMWLEIIGALGILAFVLICIVLRGICVAIRELTGQVQRGIWDLQESINASSRAISSVTSETGEQLEAIQRLLKPMAYVAESQAQSMEASHLAEVSRSVDHITEAVERAKIALVAREKGKAHAQEEGMKSDAATQANVREEHRLIRSQRVRELRETVEGQDGKK